MNYLLDTGFWFGLINQTDRQHKPIAAAVRQLRQAVIYVPTPVITEVAYLVRRDLGAEALALFTEKLAASEFLLIEPVTADYQRAAAIIRKYDDAHIDFVDAIVVAMAERLEITHILTLDQRHFRLFRPQHCPAFVILP